MGAEELLEKLTELRARDRELVVFGASAHRYVLEPALTEQAIKRLEERHGVEFPEEYRVFLVRMGNGGAGPSYGVFPFGKWDGVGADLERWTRKKYVVSSLAESFSFTEAWSLPDERLRPPDEFVSEEEEDEWCRQLDEALSPAELTRGWFPICHHGCALRTYLVVSGPERGHVWYDARAEEGPVRPHVEKGQRLTFFDWYDRWLDRSLEGVAALSG
jgi:SMI1 / KNR4 family (SUKH-1)